MTNHKAVIITNLHFFIVILRLHCFHPSGNGLQFEVDTVNMLLLGQVLNIHKKRDDYKSLRAQINMCNEKQSRKLRNFANCRPGGKAKKKC